MALAWLCISMTLIGSLLLDSFLGFPLAEIGLQLDVIVTWFGLLYYLDTIRRCPTLKAEFFAKTICRGVACWGLGHRLQQAGDCYLIPPQRRPLKSVDPLCVWALPRFESSDRRDQAVSAVP